MAATTTASPAVDQKVWVQTEGCDLMYLTIEPHTTVIDDVKRMVLGNDRCKYKAFHRGQYLRPDGSVPTDASGEEPIQFKRIRNPRSISFIDDDDDADVGLSLEAVNERRIRTMLSNIKTAAKVNKCMNKWQGNCT